MTDIILFEKWTNPLSKMDSLDLLGNSRQKSKWHIMNRQIVVDPAFFLGTCFKATLTER